MGRSYVIDNCTAYIKEREYNRQRDYYLSDMLLMLNNRFRNENEDIEIPRFCDLANQGNRQSEKKPKTAVEVKTQIKSKMKNMFRKKED